MRREVLYTVPLYRNRAVRGIYGSVASGPARKNSGSTGTLALLVDGLVPVIPVLPRIPRTRAYECFVKLYPQILRFFYESTIYTSTSVAILVCTLRI